MVDAFGPCDCERPLDPSAGPFEHGGTVAEGRAGRDDVVHEQNLKTLGERCTFARKTLARLQPGAARASLLRFTGRAQERKRRQTRAAFQLCGKRAPLIEPAGRASAARCGNANEHASRNEQLGGGSREQVRKLRGKVAPSALQRQHGTAQPALVRAERNGRDASGHKAASRDRPGTAARTERTFGSLAAGASRRIEKRQHALDHSALL